MLGYAKMGRVVIGGAKMSRNTPHLAFQCNGGVGIVEDPLHHVEMQDGGTEPIRLVFQHKGGLGMVEGSSLMSK